MGQLFPAAFGEGDEVVLTGGPYWGTPATFLRLRGDVNWADLREHNGALRCHPVAWISHAPAKPGLATASGQ